VFIPLGDSRTAAEFPPEEKNRLSHRGQAFTALLGSPARGGVGESPAGRERAIVPSPPDIPLGVYVHLPWCVRKCPYCDFNSHELRGIAPFAAYVDALLEDLEEDLPLAAGRHVASVFFGGGTPSLCPPPLIARFLDGLAARLPFVARRGDHAGSEPWNHRARTIQRSRRAGINRVSLGVQSFQPRLLASIGRIHDDRDALAAIDELARAGIDNFNLDLMFGLPGQTAAEAAADLAIAVAASPAHLSLYQLTLEPGTPFFRRPPSLPDEDACWEMETAAAYSWRAGIPRYEVSAWSRPGRECRHNLNYWSFGDYLGLGAGAHGKVTLADGRIMRRQRRRRPLGWLQGPRLEAEQALDARAPVRVHAQCAAVDGWLQ
jgi:putative oxygen-independent coproporphyrinogen III oxidase